MKALRWFFVCLILLAAWMAGCNKDEDPSDPSRPPPQVQVVRLFLESDTLTFLPGDSAQVDGYARVWDDRGNTVPDLKLDFSLENPFTGVIEFASVLGDTTNDSGRVDFTFRSFVDAGVNRIFVRVPNVDHPITDTATVVVLPSAGLICRVDLFTVPITLVLGDSAQVVAHYTDCAGAPVPGINISLSSNLAGRYTPLPPTDSTGLARTWYFPLVPGEHRLMARYEDLADSTTVSVRLQSFSLQMVAHEDTVYAYQGDTARVAVTAYLRDALNRPVPGMVVDLTLSNPQIGFIEYLNPSRDTTESFGRVDFRTLFYEAGPQQVRATLHGLAVSDTVDLTCILRIADPAFVEVYADQSTVQVTDTAQVFARVTDVRGHGVAGVEVGFDADCGPWLDPSQVTGADGITMRRFRSNRVGLCRIDGYVGENLFDSTLIRIVTGPPAFATITLSEDTILAGDSTQVFVQVTDSADYPVPGAALSLEPHCSGSFSHFPLTDALGRTSTFFWPLNGGTCNLSVKTEDDRPLPGSAPLVVVPRAGALQLIAEMDTVMFVPGDSAMVSMVVRVVDDHGLGLAGAVVHWSFSDPDIGEILYDTPSADTTDSGGWVRCRYLFYTAGEQFITAQVQNVADVARLVCLSYCEPDWRLNIALFPDYLGVGDTMGVYILLTNAVGDGQAGVYLNLFTNCRGNLQPLPPTDESGRCNTSFVPSQAGDWDFFIACGEVQDFATFVVAPGTSGHRNSKERAAR